MKLIIAGSRTITYLPLLEAYIREAELEGWMKTADVEEEVCGEASGVDTLGKLWALKNNIPVRSMPARWSTLGRGAGYIRNVAMANYADAALILWDGASAGTKHMIEISKAKDLKLRVVNIKLRD